MGVDLISTMGALTAAVGKKEKPTDTGSVRDPRVKEPILDPGTMVSRCQESILGRGNFIYRVTLLYTRFFLGTKTTLGKLLHNDLFFRTIFFFNYNSIAHTVIS